MPSITPINLERPNFSTLHEFGEVYKTDVLQKTIVDATIVEPFLPWLLLVLLLNFKRQKKPVIYLLISFWLVKFLNSVISGYLFVAHDGKDSNRMNKFNEGGFKEGEFEEEGFKEGGKSMIKFVLFAITIWLVMISQVIGDWYPVLRTKAVVHNKKSLRLVYTTCIIYNIAKLIGPFSFFIPINQPTSDVGNDSNKIKKPSSHKLPSSYQHNPEFSPLGSIGDTFGPFGTMGTPDIFDDQNNPLKNIMLYLYICIGVSFLASIIYDISIIYVLKKDVFNKVKIDEQLPNMKKQSFIEKFKLMSEYRIYVSMFVTVIALPTLIIYICTFFYRVWGNDNDDDDNKRHSLFPFCMIIFNIVMKFNYCIMFIDQILLRYYAERNNPNIVMANNKSIKSNKSNFSYSSTIPRTPGTSFTPRTLNYNSLKSNLTSPTSVTDDSNSVITFSNSNYSPFPFSTIVNNFNDTASSTTNSKINSNTDGEYHFINKNNLQFTSLHNY